jgi:hypothetical protein
VWAYGDQDQPRFWSIYTGDPTFRPFFRYQVHVVVKGSLFAKGQAWLGPWVDTNGNGPITIAVPTPDSAGVQMKEAPPIMVVGADGRVVREGMPSSTRPREIPATTRPMTVAGYAADTSSAPAEPAYAGSGDGAGHGGNGASRSGPSAGNGHGDEGDASEYRELEVTAWHS